MSVVRCFEDARAVLGLEHETEPGAVKRAYRRALREHPPDLDPEGFRSIREAYELLTDAERATALLSNPSPLIPPPAAPNAPPARRGSAAVAVLRWAVTQIDAARLEPNRVGEGEKEQR